MPPMIPQMPPMIPQVPQMPPMPQGSAGFHGPMPQIPQMSQIPQGIPQMPPGLAAQTQRPNIFSIRPLPYQGLALFSDSNFRSQVLYVNANVDDLAAYNFNNQTSSLIVISGDFLVQGRGGQYLVSRFGGPLHDGTYPVAQTWNGRDNDVYKIIKVNQ